MREGHPTTREDLVTAFRLVEFHPGSAIMELEPMRVVSDEPQLYDAELLAVENLQAFMDTIESEDVIEPAVTDAIESARKTLGADGRIEITVARRAQRARKRVVIDETVVRSLEQRARRRSARPLRIVGRLHMLDDEPRKVGIRTSDNVDWICTYPTELEEAVAALMRTRVVARGVGAEQSPNRGRLEISAIEGLNAYEQSSLFTFERVPIDHLIEQQGIRAAHGAPRLLDDDAEDDEIDAFLDALMEG